MLTSSRDYTNYLIALGNYRKKGMYFAVKNALTTAAEMGKLRYIKSAKANLTLRNHWTVGSIKHFKARGSAVNNLNSVYGSYAQYMLLQEYGDRSAGKSGNKAIPTYFAAYGRRGNGKRKKTPMAKFKMSAITKSKVGHKPGTRIDNIFQLLGRGGNMVVGGHGAKARRGAYLVSMRPTPVLKGGVLQRLKFDAIYDTEKKDTRTPRKALMFMTNYGLNQAIPGVMEGFLQREVERNFSRLRRVKG